MNEPTLSALLEAIIYLAEEPVRIEQIQKALPDIPREEILAGVKTLVERFRTADHGVEVREVASGYRFATKPEHHEVLKAFTKSLIPPTRLSLAALETLAVIAYRQPITIPEIQEIRGVQASGVIRTLLDRKLATAAGRKDVIGRPILYKTTRQFLIHFGLKDLSELPSIEEFEELLKSEHASEAEGPLEAEPETGLRQDQSAQEQHREHDETDHGIDEADHGTNRHANQDDKVDAANLDTEGEDAPGEGYGLSDPDDAEDLQAGTIVLEPSEPAITSEDPSDDSPVGDLSGAAAPRS